MICLMQGHLEVLFRKNCTHSQPGHTSVHRPQDKHIKLKKLLLQRGGLANLMCREDKESLCEGKIRIWKALLLDHKSYVR